MSGPAATADQTCWQPQILDQLRRELGDDDGTMIAEIVALYLAQARELLRQLTAAADTSDEAQLRELAHFLKGSSSAVGGIGLARLCQGLESGTYSESPIATTLEAVHEEFDRLAGSLSFPAVADRPRTLTAPDLSTLSDEVSDCPDGNRA